MEEKDELRDLFRNFDPELSGDNAFMSRLQRHMESVEEVRRQTAAMRRRYRRAVGVAACAGFVAGALFSWAVPYLSGMLAGLAGMLPGVASMGVDADQCLILTWMLAVGCTAAVSVNAYEVALALMKARS